ncbi:glycosyltransferase family 4 protein [Butyrivibrio sp. AE3009]|uniref:glycosyltransferase family 4 protein n=1 Tax=Butyrivibrio sp. AE3009 TaxID=1280666 RepID=UPI0003B39AF4|nr:glycosyltransferase family 4 protein [Butyrivibrio sp. AE3009]
MKKVLHLLAGGGAGGIEILCEQIGLLGKERHEFCFLFGMGEIADRMRGEGLQVYDITEGSFLNKLGRLKALARKNGYDAVIVHHEGVGTYLFYYLLHKTVKAPKYFKYLHCSFEDRFFYTGNKLKDKLHYMLLTKVLRSSDALIAVSEFTKKSYVEEFKLSPDKVKVVYNGIKAIEDEARSKEHDNANLLYIGRLVDVKGVDVLVDALGILVNDEKLCHIHLDILGDGPARVELEQKAKALGLKDIVTFYGVQLNKAPFYDKAKIFVYPPIWQEAFGISIIEAMSQGLICVASDVGGIPEIITDGQDGLLFEAGSPKALAEALNKAIAITGGSDAAEFIKASRRRAADFTIEKSIEGLESIV